MLIKHATLTSLVQIQRAGRCLSYQPKLAKRLDTGKMSAWLRSAQRITDKPWLYLWRREWEVICPKSCASSKVCTCGCACKRAPCHCSRRFAPAALTGVAAPGTNPVTRAAGARLETPDGRTGHPVAVGQVPPRSEGPVPRPVGGARGWRLWLCRGPACVGDRGGATTLGLGQSPSKALPCQGSEVCTGSPGGTAQPPLKNPLTRLSKPRPLCPFI